MSYDRITEYYHEIANFLERDLAADNAVRVDGALHRIRQALPQFRDRSLEDTRTSLRRGDTLNVVAREAGYGNWRALAEGGTPDPNPTRTADPRDALLRDLFEWGERMGGWDARVWEDLRRHIGTGLAGSAIAPVDRKAQTLATTYGTVVVEGADGSGTVSSNLRRESGNEVGDLLVNATVEAIERVLLALGANGVDISTKAHANMVETIMDWAGNEYDDPALEVTLSDLDPDVRKRIAVVINRGICERVILDDALEGQVEVTLFDLDDHADDPVLESAATVEFGEEAFSDLAREVEEFRTAVGEAESARVVTDAAGVRQVMEINAGDVVESHDKRRFRVARVEPKTGLLSGRYEDEPAGKPLEVLSPKLVRRVLVQELEIVPSTVDALPNPTKEEVREAVIAAFGEDEGDWIEIWESQTSETGWEIMWRNDDGKRYYDVERTPSGRLSFRLTDAK